jgi:PAS domain S-box-containing protein
MMKRDMIYNPFLHRSGAFSGYWFEIFRTRLLLTMAAIVYVLSNSNQKDRILPPVVSALSYITINLLLGLLAADILHLRRVRVLPDILDVVFVSIMIYYTGNQASFWFLVYIFPIVSASRYLGNEGSLVLAGLALLLYLLGSINPPAIAYLDLPAFILKIFILFGIALTAGNLAKTRKTEEQNLMELSKELHNEILSDIATDEILTLILKRAIEYSDSDRGKIEVSRYFGNGSSTNITVGNIIELERDFGKPYKGMMDEVTKSKKTRIFPNFRDTPIVDYIKASTGNIGSCLTAPLLLGSEIIGAITVASPKRIHYTKRETAIIESFARYVVLALQTNRLVKQLTLSSQERETERKERLRMLHAIAGQLTASADLTTLCNDVVSLTYDRLNAEEAALFLRQEGFEDRIIKVAVCGPDEYVTNALLKDENSYISGRSYTGEVFESGKPKIENKIDQGIEFGAFYRRILPSKSTGHYLGVPLIIGNESLGVLRVINKKSKSYSLKQGNYGLSGVGFDQEDLELMQIIASQVAAATHAARLLEKYKAAQTYYSTLVASSPDPIIALDEKGRIEVFNNACEGLWKCSSEEALEKPVKGFYESEGQARNIGKILWSAAGYRLQNYETRIRTKQGELIPINLSAAFLFNEKGKRIGSIGVFKDLRDEKRLQEQLLQTKKLEIIRMLAGTVIHDVKHDIGACLFYIDTLLYKCNKEAEAELFKVYTNIKEALWKAIEELQDVLLAGNPKPLQKEKVKLHNIFQVNIEKMIKEAQARHIEFHVRHDENHPELMLDADQFQRVLWNLFNTSIYAVEDKQHSQFDLEPGRIQLSTCVIDDHIELRWEDNGCGISESDIPHIFTAFFSNKRSRSGTGLGLYIVKTIVESHEGEIDVYSKLGEGTRFTIRLPIL